MPAIAGLLGALGTVASLAGSFAQTSAAKAGVEIQRQQMNLEATRQRRQIIRQSVIAQSQALSNATASGAQYGSGLAGGLSQITSQEATGVGNLSQNVELGNRSLTNSENFISARGLTYTGGGMESLGGAIVNNLPLFKRLGLYKG